MYSAARPPFHRIMVIDRELRMGGWPNRSTLGRELEVSPRTTRRDMDFMRDQLHAPIEFDPVHNGYFYRDTSYRLPFFQLREGELLALYLADRISRQLRGTPFESDLKCVIDKLGTMLPETVSVRLDSTADLLAILPTAEWDYNPQAFGVVLSAVTRRRQVEMVYWTAGRNENNRRIVDPYGLAWGDDGWYMVGHCHLRVAIRTFAIQRIKSVDETGEAFGLPADFRIVDYMKGSFRSFRGDGHHHVVLRFAPEVAPRIAEKQWHSSQTLEPQPDDSLIVHFDLSSLVEMKRWVMAWGIECQVLEPAELRESIVREAREILRREEAEIH
jgi:predicted DNA-binding transcriptional regulator YafY